MTRNVAPPRGIMLKGEGATEEGVARAVETQQRWARDVADGLERGEAPHDQQERRVLAAIVRLWADELHAPKASKRGNPDFVRKLPDDDTIPIAVGMRIGFGDDQAEAIRHVAEAWGVDESTIAKVFRDRREAVADFLAGSNLRNRVGAIRGE